MWIDIFLLGKNMFEIVNLDIPSVDTHNDQSIGLET